MIRSTRALVVRGLALRLRVSLPLAPAVVEGIANGRCCPPHSPTGNNKPHGVGVSLVSFLSARPMSVGVEALREDDAVPEEGSPRSESMSQGLEISKIGVEQEIVDALARRSIVRLFPIQGAVLEPAMKGQDLIGRAKTGTGKTLAFGIPIINHVIKENKGSRGMRPYGKRPLALVLAPTRELAKQVEKEFKESAPSLMTVCVYGGTSIIMQQQQLQRGVDIAVGTPGRVIDLLERGSLNLGEVKFVVLDEADQMLRVGFAEDVEKIAGYLPAVRQSMLFSATMPDWVKNISRKYLKNPIIVDLVGENDEKLAEGIKLFSIPTVNSAKRSVLSDLIAVYGKSKKTIVFTQTKRDADDVASTLGRAHACEALHGDITQAQREKTLNGFREGRFKVLVATDVASRGLDVPNVDLVIHYEIPNDSETFVHRSGRTGRAGKEGVAILMYTLQQNRTISIIERDVGCKFEKISPPSAEEVIKSTADQAVGALQKVHPDLRGIFLPIAEKLLSEQGAGAFASALACLSGFTQPPASRSLLTHEQGWTTLRLSRPKSGPPLFTTQSVIAALAQICPSATNRVGKIQMLNEVDVQGAVFDMPESIAKELLSLQHNSSDTLDAPKQLPNIVEDIPSTSYYGRSFGGGGGFGNRPRVGPPFNGRNDSYGRPSTGDRSSGERPSFYPPNNGTSGPRMSTPYPGGPGSSGVRMPPPPYSGGNGVSGFRMSAPYPPYPGRVADNSSSGLRPPTPYSYGSNTGTGDRVIGGSAGSFVSSLGRNGASFNEDRGGGLADFGRSLSERKFDSGVGGIGSSDSTLLNDKWNKCQLCGQPGHFARNCPTLQKS